MPRGPGRGWWFDVNTMVLGWLMLWLLVGTGVKAQEGLTGKGSKAWEKARQALAEARNRPPSTTKRASPTTGEQVEGGQPHSESSAERDEVFVRYREAVKDAGPLAGEALFHLAAMHLDGDDDLGVERDWSQALKLATESAREFGSPQAHHLLGIAHATGVFGAVQPQEAEDIPPLPHRQSMIRPESDSDEEDLEEDEEDDDDDDDGFDFLDDDDELEADEESYDEKGEEREGEPLKDQGQGGQEGDIDEIHAILHEYFGAIGGDVSAAMGMGYRYLYGYGTPAECDMAVLYYEMAANHAVEEIKRRKILPYLDPVRLSDVAGTGPQSRKRRNSDQQVVEYYEHTAMKGDTAAQVELGKLYYYGRGVEQNLAKAAAYFEAAARAGDPVAAGFMGHMYIMGIGVDQNNDTALTYLSQGERSQEAGSLNGLGYMYMHGMGVERSLEKANRYFHKAAHEKGHSDAFYNLGLIFAGEVMDDEDQGDESLGPRSSHSLSNQSPARAESMSPSSADPSQRAQSKNKHSSSSPGVLPGEGQTGTPQMQPHHHQHPPGGKGDPLNPEGTVGVGTKKNLQKALKYFSLAAQTGHVLALHKIGQMYSQGIATGKSCNTAVHAFKGVSERGPWVSTDFNKAYQRFKFGDLTTALLYYIKLAEIGYEVAQSNAAYLLEEHHTCGKLDRIDCEKLAFRYFKHSSKQGNAEASLKVGDIYYYGKAGFPVDHEKAGKFYQAAAELRHPQAMFNLGFMHQHGIGLRQDFHLAKRYYDSAAETHPDAKWPVNLALAGLMLQWRYLGPLETWWAKLIKGEVAQQPPEKDDSNTREIGGQAQTAATVPNPMARMHWPYSVRLASEALERMWKTVKSWHWSEWMPTIDTFLIIVCTTALFYVMWIRQQEGRRRRRTLQQQQGIGQG